jgi:hypothetical protein
MEAVANAARALSPALRNTISNPTSKTDVQAMYQLLRGRGVLPTVAQAIAIGDNDEAKKLIADEFNQKPSPAAGGQRRALD